MIILVCGGRTYSDQQHVFNTLDQCRQFYGGFTIVQGGAAGADRLAFTWAQARGMPCLTMWAPWDYYGKRAGTIRNEWMLITLKPEIVLAFPGGSGTAHMKRIAQSAGVPVYEV